MTANYLPQTHSFGKNFVLRQSRKKQNKPFIIGKQGKLRKKGIKKSTQLLQLGLGIPPQNTEHHCYSCSCCCTLSDRLRNLKATNKQRRCT
uniref:Uncharacterized protein n=1 Tax=Rhizophora mucronata TaxID=61149 RepID=A0A2P2IVI8_RHIMU